MRVCGHVDFFHLAGTIHMHGTFPHMDKSAFLRKIPMSKAWYKKLCRPFQNTLEFLPLKSFLLPLLFITQAFPHGLCFFASGSRLLLFASIPPYLSEYHASTSGTLLRALAVLASLAAAAEDALLSWRLRQAAVVAAVHN
jgi:hypothetical protein